jgi:SPP1 family predicted phage head-tail adaptor
MRRQTTLTIEEDVIGNELAGEPATTSQEFARAFGAIMPLTGNEYVRAQQMDATVSHKIRTEYIAGVNPRMRLKHGDRTFNVVSVVNVEERNRELEWMCTEVV